MAPTLGGPPSEPERILRAGAVEIAVSEDDMGREHLSTDHVEISVFEPGGPAMARSGCGRMTESLPNRADARVSGSTGG